MYRTRFVGRAEELNHLASLLDGGARLVTLVGPPGVGKTRLAAQLADRRDDARFHDLTEARGRADLDRLVAGDRTAPGLLVLDNFDHLVATAAATLTAWLDATPALAVLVTSREELRAPGEHVVPLAPLALPDGTDESAVRASPAAELFLDRAAGYELTAADAPHVARIVRELDGLPLALELAASRMKILSPAGLADRLEKRLEVLGALRGAIDWSWSLLGDNERSVLAQCSVFRGSFPLDAAEDVIDAAGASILDAFQGLAEKSLLRSFRGPAGNVRFALYESIREFAAERLAERPEHVAAVFRHGRYYARVTRILGEHGGGGRGLSMVRRLELDLDNLLGAFESLLDHPSRLRAAATRAMENTDALLHQLSGRGKLGSFHALRDAAADVSAALETFDDAEVTPRLRAAVYRFIAVGYAVFARPAEADAYFDRALAVADAAGDASARGRTLYAAGTLASSAHRYDDARRALDEALAIARRTGDQRLEANLLAEVGHLHLRQRRPDPAIAAFDRALELARAMGRPDGEAYLEANAAAAARDKGDLDTAAARLARALALHDAAGDDLHAGAVIAHQGALAHERGDLDAAIAHYRAALDRIAATGARRIEGLILCWLGGAHARADDRDAAAATFEEAAARANDLGDPLLAQCLALHRASLDLAASRAAPDPETAAAHRARAAAAAAADTDDTNDEVRFARRLLDRELAAGAWTLAADGTWFESPDDPRVDLSRKKRLTRLLAALVARHAASPGSALPADQLIAEVWEGERMDPQSGHNRIQVALTTLRKLGLRELITRDDRGYFLDPHVPLRIEGLRST